MTSSLLYFIWVDGVKSQRDVRMMRNESVKIKQSLQRESVDYRPEVTFFSTFAYQPKSCSNAHLHKP
jgi:hypothetical protein